MSHSVVIPAPPRGTIVAARLIQTGKEYDAYKVMVADDMPEFSDSYIVWTCDVSTTKPTEDFGYFWGHYGLTRDEAQELLSR